MATAQKRVVFIHGLWLHASSWENWIEFFREAGYDAPAPGWPGDSSTVEETRLHPESIAGKGVDEVTEHYARIIRSFDSKPIVIGHSFGGLVAQKLLGQNLAAGAVAIDAAQMKGVLPLPFAQLRSVWPVLRNPANLNRAVSLTAEEFRYGFGNAIPEGGVRGALRALDDSGAGKAPLFGGGGQLQPALAGQGEHRKWNARPASAHRRRQGSHGSGRGHPRCVQALSQVSRRDGAEGVSRPRPLAWSGQRLAGDRRVFARLAAAAFVVRMGRWLSIPPAPIQSPTDRATGSKRGEPQRSLLDNRAPAKFRTPCFCMASTFFIENNGSSF